MIANSWGIMMTSSNGNILRVTGLSVGNSPGTNSYLSNEWYMRNSWWRHQMQTFSALLAICARNSSVPGEFPARRPVTRGLNVFFDLHPYKRLGNQWWFETPPCSLRRHCAHYPPPHTHTHTHTTVYRYTGFMIIVTYLLFAMMVKWVLYKYYRKWCF